MVWPPGGRRVGEGFLCKPDVLRDLAKQADPIGGEMVGDASFTADSSSTPGEEYRPERTAMLVKPVDENGGEVRDWPLKHLSQTEPWDGNKILGNRCMIVPTEQADQITSAMKEAKKPIVWRSGGKLYRVRPHPLLPHEKDCGTVQPYFWPS